jgi:hypothetical protein
MAEKQAAHRQELESRALSGDLLKSMMGTVLAYITFGGSMFGAVYFLLHDKPIQSLAALIVALSSAFGPKIYTDFHPNQGTTTTFATHDVIARHAQGCASLHCL